MEDTNPTQSLLEKMGIPDDATVDVLKDKLIQIEEARLAERRRVAAYTIERYHSDAAFREKRKADVIKAQRKRYQEDPEYRAKVLLQNREAYARRQALKKQVGREDPSNVS